MSMIERIKALFTKYDVRLSDEEIAQLKADEGEEKEMSDNPEKEEEQMVSAKLASGQEVVVQKEFAEGEKVYALTDEGEKMPLPEGEYEMEGGKKMKVDEEGTILAVEVTIEEEEDEEEEVMGADKKEKEELTTEDVKQIVAEALVDFYKELSETKETLSALKEAPVPSVMHEAPKKKFSREEIAKAQTTQERVKLISQMF